jgi:biopolymer transport protein ExbD
MSASTQTALKAEPNLTPLLDVVFQLITFFMLVINFTNDNYDQRIKLPVAGSARPLDDPRAAEEDRLVLNIDNHGDLLLNGKTLHGNAVAEQIKFEAQLVRLNKKAVAAKGQDEGLPTRIVIRADRDAECGPIYSIINACQSNGFRKFDFKAMTK